MYDTIRIIPTNARFSVYFPEYLFLQIPIEQNRCAMACQGCGAVFLSLNQKAVETKS